MSLDVYRIPDKLNSVCIIVGLGLIGAAVQRVLAIEGKRVTIARKSTMDWSSSESIFQEIEPYLRLSDSRVEVIWCAGKSGFLATNSQLEGEFVIFERTMEKLSKYDRDISVSFLSSAGGLYEGSGGALSRSGQITPLRPYGIWKSKQEECLISSALRAKIYRISSVYGSNSTSSRRGILSALFESSYLNRPATVYAKASTL